MSTIKINQIFETTWFRQAIKTAVAAIVGAVVGYLVKLDSALPTWAVYYIIPVALSAYYTGVTALESRFPWMSWLLLVLPQPPKSPTPAPTPTPAASSLTYVETPSGNRWAADVNTMQKADEVTKAAAKTQPTVTPKSQPKTKRTSGR